MNTGNVPMMETSTARSSLRYWLTSFLRLGLLTSPHWTNYSKRIKGLVLQEREEVEGKDQEFHTRKNCRKGREWDLKLGGTVLIPGPGTAGEERTHSWWCSCREALSDLMASKWPY